MCCWSTRCWSPGAAILPPWALPEALRPRLPAQELWNDAYRSSLGHLSQRPDLSLLMLAPLLRWLAPMPARDEGRVAL